MSLDFPGRAGMTRRALGILAGLALLAVVLLWTVPVLGFVACAAVLVVAAPWGRTLTERGIISTLVVLGLIALTVPRASSVPVTWLSAHLGLSVVTLGVVGLRLVPRLRTPIPRPDRIDVLVGLLVLGQGLWLVAAYLGRSTIEVLSGLYHSGWDNSGHFIPFANTLAEQATAWPTTDGSVAWNQWYPSLHTTAYALAELATQGSGVVLTRPEMLVPYVVWTAVAFALSIGALAWLAADLAARGARALRPTRPWLARVAPAVAVAAFGAFGLLGSPAFLFNYGFTNFVMAVAVMAVTAYLSARSWASARRLGWLLLPLGAVAVNGLWTPLVLGLAPAGVIVLIALWRERRWLAPAWAVVSGVIVGWSVLGQSQAITPNTGGSGGLLEDLGAAAVGMAPFNIGAALAAPVAAVLLGVVLVRSGRVPLGVAVGAPSVLVAAFAVVAWSGASQAGVAGLTSYYVLKVLDALLIMNAPVLAAAAAIAGAEAVHALKRRLPAGSEDRIVNRPNAALVAVAGVVVGVSVLGYAGPTQADLQAGFRAAPGIEAGQKRAGAVQDSLVGEAILAAQGQAVPYPELTTMLWDGSGTLVNIWLASLHGVMSSQDQRFYKYLPAFPYDEKTVEYVDFALSSNPDLRLAVLWFRDVSGAQVASLPDRNPGRVTVVQVPLRPSPLCQECSL